MNTLNITKHSVWLETGFKIEAEREDGEALLVIRDLNPEAEIRVVLSLQEIRQLAEWLHSQAS